MYSTVSDLTRLSAQIKHVAVPAEITLALNYINEKYWGDYQVLGHMEEAAAEHIRLIIGEWQKIQQ